MVIFRVLLLCAAALCASHVAGAQPPAAGAPGNGRDVLKTLRPGHPRLYAAAQDMERVKETIARDPLAGRWYALLKADAEKILIQPPVEHKLIGPRLLDKSRTALDRMLTLGLVYRIDMDRRFAERARQELLTVCAFRDWNPLHFLDVAEMSHAVAVGYDWFYDYLSPSDRSTIRDALVRNGLKPGIEAYRHAGNGVGWWVRVPHNWNQVCNGGLTIAALAIADEEPDLAAYIVRQAAAAVPRAMASYAPDGGWAEGPAYWGYATYYNVAMLAALDSALGTDFGLSRKPGFAEAGRFRLDFVGPTDRTFNFADAHDREGNASVLFWLARRFHNPLYAWIEREAVTRPSAFDLIWFEPDAKGPVAAKTPLDALYKHIDVAFLRGAWENKDAVFVGFKGGDNMANHSHLDLGTFVLDADGQRWALDLGSDDYNMPGYFGNQRWDYYRLRTEGHNTLLIDGANQEITATAPITAFHSDPEAAYAVADLTNAYRHKLSRWQRGITLIGRRRVLVQDELEANAPVDVLWSMHTAATITIVSSTQAVLRANGAEMNVALLEPAGAKFEMGSAAQPPPQNPNAGVSKLLVRLSDKATQVRIVVLFTPSGRRTAFGVPRITPLADWIARAPVKTP